MTNYTKTTDFAAKDSLPSGNAAKIVKGSEIDTEFNNIATASATKANANDAVLTGTTTAQTLDISGNVDVDGTLETDALSINGVTVTSTAAELNILDGVTSTAAELNILDGVTSTTAELNILDGVTSTTAELNILDGVTSTTAELNILDGVTSTAAELNILDGVTATTAELNYVDGVTSNVQTQLNTKAPLASPTFTGTVTAAGLTVSNSSLQVKLEELDGTNNPRLVTYFDSSGTHLQHTWSSGADSLFLEYGGSEGSGTKALGIQGGDISFYEDTGTTPKLFWDASAERLGIGTVSPYSALTVDTANGILNIANGNTSGGTKIQAWAATPANGYLAIEGYDKEYMRIDASGNVGIGNTNPSDFFATADNLVLGGGSGSNGMTIYSGTGNFGNIYFADGTSGNAEYRGYIAYDHSGDSLRIATAASEAMRIDSSGNVSVSSSAGLIENAVGVFMLPAGELRVKDSTEDGTAQISTYNNNVTSDAEQFFVGNNLADVDIGNKRGGLKFFANSATERMRIDTSGNLLVGTTAGSFGARITAQSTSSYTFESRRTGTGSQGHVVFRNANGAVGTIFTNGSSTSYNTSSDQRLKDNIADAPSASDDIDAIQVRSFDWKADGSHQKYGMVAQELQSVAPEAVTGDADSDEMMAVDYSKLVPMLVKEIQTLRNRVAQLENN